MEYSKAAEKKLRTMVWAEGKGEEIMELRITCSSEIWQNAKDQAKRKSERERGKEAKKTQSFVVFRKRFFFDYSPLRFFC